MRIYFYATIIVAIYTYHKQPFIDRRKCKYTSKGARRGDDKNGTSSMMKNICYVFYAVFISFFSLQTRSWHFS